MAADVLGSSMSRQTRQGLRRATYVHVSDLTSAYNIDHARLEQELSRVKLQREAATSPTKDPELEEDPNSGAASELDPALVPVPQKRLQPPRGGYNLCVLVGKLNVVVDKRRVDRSRVRLAEVEIGDETGTVSLRARDEQIDVLSEVSEREGAVVLRNCTLELYQGKHIRLAVTKWGKLCVYPDNVASTPPPPPKMNHDRNFSLIDLSAVASEMVDPQPKPSYSSRTSKSPDPPSASSRPTSSKYSGQPSGRQQSQSSKKRSNRDRRQRGRSGSSGGGSQALAHYGVPQGDVGTMQPLAGQLRYQSQHSFPGYDQGVDPRQFQYTQSRQPEVISSASARQLMMHQHHHYEMRHRQFQQMYHGSHEPHRQGMSPSHAPSPGMMLPPVVPSGSFDTTEGYEVRSYSASGPDQQPQGMSIVESNPILIPMTMAQAGFGVGLSPMTAAPPQEGSNVDQASSRQAEQQYMSVSPDDSQFSPGKMNPEAISFAPSYMNPNPQTSHQVYFPFDPSHPAQEGAYRPAPTHHQPAFNTQGMIYVPGASTSSKSPSDPRISHHVAPPGTSGASTDSQASKKENLKLT